MTAVTILGSTGTIGCNTLKIIAAHPGKFTLAALTAGENVAALIEQAKTFRPKRAVISNPAHYAALKDGLAGTGIETAAGEDAVCEAATMDSDIAMSAIVGTAGLNPTLAAIRRGAKIGLANKECLVSAGELMMAEVKKHGATLIPVDSEHSAIFQLLYPPPPLGGRPGGGLGEGNLSQMSPHPNPPPRGEGMFIERVMITASGGPFRTWTMEQMREATPAQAVKHPNWAMGAKISVDSATLMNKGLELIEAFHLFPLRAEQLGVLIHPESIVHCLVQMIDGSVLAQMSLPDMCTPIAYALSWPERIAAPVKKLDLAAIGNLQFAAPDMERFPALKLACAALKTGSSAPTILNAANEIAVGRFLRGEIGFLDIAKTVERTLETLDNTPLETIDDVLACDQAARRIAEK